VGDPGSPFPHGVGGGLGTPDAKGDRESLLDKVPGVAALRSEGLGALVGRTVCAVVFDSDVSVDHKRSTASLKGATLGTAAFEVVEVESPRRGALPAVTIRILDTVSVCRGWNIGGGNSIPVQVPTPEPTPEPEPTPGSDQPEL
jgi:hypothetical protein